MCLIHIIPHGLEFIGFLESPKLPPCLITNNSLIKPVKQIEPRVSLAKESKSVSITPTPSLSVLKSSMVYPESHKYPPAFSSHNEYAPHIGSPLLAPASPAEQMLTLLKMFRMRGQGRH